MSPPVVVTDPAPGVRMITLSRPDQLNTLEVELVSALHAELDRVARARDVRVVVLTGAGRAFCAGLDLNGYGDPERIDEQGFTLGTLDRQREIARLVEKINALPSRSSLPSTEPPRAADWPLSVQATSGSPPSRRSSPSGSSGLVSPPATSASPGCSPASWAPATHTS